MKKLLFLILLLIIPTISSAFSVYGNLDCGEWLDVRNKASSNNRADIIAIGIVGKRGEAFFDGLVLNGSFEGWLEPTKITSSQLNYMIDNYCREKPSAKIYEAMAEIYVDRKLSK